jgi:hypothetical protein
MIHYDTSKIKAKYSVFLTVIKLNKTIKGF